MKKYSILPKLIYFTGLSASGKTTLSKLLGVRLKKLGISSKYIDGDLFRRKFNLKRYDGKSREKVAIKKFTYAKKILKTKKIVIISGVGAKIKSRRRLRKKFNDYIEIRVDCPLKICISRNKKKYSKIRIKNNLNLKYEKGETHDLIVNTNKFTDKYNINKIIYFLFKKKIIF